MDDIGSKGELDSMGLDSVFPVVHLAIAAPVIMTPMVQVAMAATIIVTPNVYEVAKEI